MTNQLNKNPENSWRGPFYFNRNDRRALVPKRFGIGWTFNFASPWAWVILTILIAGIIFINRYSFSGKVKK